MTTTPHSAGPTPPAAAARPRPVHGLGTAVSVVLVLGALLVTPWYLSTWLDYALLSDFVNGRIGQEAYFDETDHWNRLGFRYVAAVSPIVVAGVITTLVWVHRARTNAGILAPHHHFRYSPGFSAGGLLVPIANLWWTPRIVTDICIGTGLPGTVRLIRAWWSINITGVVLSQIGTFALRTEIDMTEDASGRIVSVADDATSVAFAVAVLNTIVLATYIAFFVMLVPVVRRVSTRQTALLSARRTDLNDRDVGCAAPVTRSAVPYHTDRQPRPTREPARLRPYPRCDGPFATNAKAAAAWAWNCWPSPVSASSPPNPTPPPASH